MAVSGATEIALAATAAFSAQARDASGGTVAVTFTWSSSDPTVLTVDGSGNVTAVQRGTASVTATVSGDGVSGALEIDVVVGSVASFLSADSLFSLGDTAALTAVARDANGAEVAGIPITLTSSNPAIATIDSEGNVVAVANGQATLQASVDGRSVIQQITVAQRATVVTLTPGTIMIDALTVDTALTATAVDARGHPLAASSITFLSSASTIASVTGAGVVRSLANGSATITASSGPASAMTSVTVSQVAVGFDVTPATPALDAFGQTVTLSASLVDRKGQAVPSAAVVWSSSNEAVATVTPAGVATAVANGLTYVRGSGAGGIDSATLTVAQIARTVVVSPPSRVFQSIDDTETFSAVATDANGNTVVGRTVVWSVVTPGIVSVTGAGFVTALANGSTGVRAMMDAVFGEGTATVAQVATSLTLNRTRDTLKSFGEPLSYEAAATDANGHVVTTGFTWQSTTAGVVNLPGSTHQVTATAVTNGTTDVRVTRDGLSDESILVVRQTAASVVMAPTAASVYELLTQLFTATFRDARNNVMTGITVGWSSSDDARATVSASGLSTGVSAGAVTITATVDDVDGDAALTVLASPTLSGGVQPIFTNRCVSCHTGGGGGLPSVQNLNAGQAHANVVNVVSIQAAPMVRVSPAQPDQSYLVHKIQGTHLTVGGSGQRMPFGGPFLSAADITLIRAWIARGALNN